MQRDRETDERAPLFIQSIPYIKVRVVRAKIAILEAGLVVVVAGAGLDEARVEDGLFFVGTVVGTVVVVGRTGVVVGTVVVVGRVERVGTTGSVCRSKLLQPLCLQQQMELSGVHEISP